DAGRVALQLMGEGRFEPALFADCTAERLAAGALPLARAAGVWELMATGGGLRQLWPAVLRIAESAVALRPRPVGLAEVFAWLTRPDVAAAALLAVADVAATTYADFGLAKRIAHLDPVVTASGDRLRFESFSACNGVHARFDLLPAGIDSGEAGFGSTNVDI